MITGDHPLTAKAIAKELKIWNDENKVADEFVYDNRKRIRKVIY